MSLRKKQSSKKSPQSSGPGQLPPQHPSSDSSATRNSLPDDGRTRLAELFGLIEREFETLYTENAALREKVDTLSERLDMLVSEQRSHNLETTHPPYPHNLVPSSGSSSNILPMSELPPPHSATPLRKIKSSGSNITKKLLPGPKKSASNMKPIAPESTYVCSYLGHRDGVWDISYAKNGQPVIGTASADNTACIWDATSGQVHLKYTGHVGSVNSIAFHPTESLVATASGDCCTHIWKFSVNSSDKQSTKDSSGEDRLSDEEDQSFSTDNLTVKTPVLSLQEHTGPVMACDWFCDGEQLVSASWDHLALLWDVQTGTRIHSLTGHDDELNHVSTHPTQKLLVTSSQDTTFRLWDFRAPLIHSVNVFQGHSKAVTSAVFSMKDNVISASDDHTVKIWDLHKMRHPIASIRLDCGVNRISVSHDHHVLAVPLDNRQIRLYDLGGNRLAILPYRKRKGHYRMVHSVCWSHDKLMTSSSPTKCNLFSASFDSRIIGWKVQF